jgi:hypothetical protein
MAALLQALENNLVDAGSSVPKDDIEAAAFDTHMASYHEDHRSAFGPVARMGKVIERMAFSGYLMAAKIACEALNEPAFTPFGILVALEWLKIIKREQVDTLFQMLHTMLLGCPRLRSTRQPVPRPILYKLFFEAVHMLVSYAPQPGPGVGDADKPNGKTAHWGIQWAFVIELPQSLQTRIGNWMNMELATARIVAQTQLLDRERDPRRGGGRNDHNNNGHQNNNRRDNDRGRDDRVCIPWLNNACRGGRQCEGTHWATVSKVRYVHGAFGRRLPLPLENYLAFAYDNEVAAPDAGALVAPLAAPAVVAAGGKNKGAKGGGKGAIVGKGVVG